jgi:hypothetical protein
LEERVSVDGVASRGGDVDRLEAAAERLRREVFALKELGDQHADLGRQVEALNAKREAVAREYQKRYQELAGGRLVIHALRQLGMNGQLGGVAAKKARRKKASAHTPGASGSQSSTPDPERTTSVAVS